MSNQNHDVSNVSKRVRQNENDCQIGDDQTGISFSIHALSNHFAFHTLTKPDLPGTDALTFHELLNLDWCRCPLDSMKFS
jgi:hypothetical protein